MKRAGVLIKGDIKNISRDPILLMSVFVPLLVSLVMKFGLPFASGILMDELAFDLTVYYELIISIMLLVSPLMLGMLSGFIILDEKDENLLTYYSITPLTKTGYLIYRMFFPIACGFVMTFFMIGIIGFVYIPFSRLLPIVLLVSMEAPMTALVLGIFAANKVEGLAISKAMGIFFFTPVAGYFIRSDWQLLAGIVPTYWISKAYIAGVNGLAAYWMYILAGMAVHLFYTYILYRQFEKKAL
ncbi:MAG: hypothetical protein ACOZCL_01260 [Bacillota bacterium]